MLGLLPFSFDRNCPRCAHRLEPDFLPPPLLARGLMRLARRSAWRWCRRCNWRGLTPRSARMQTARSGD